MRLVTRESTVFDDIVKLHDASFNASERAPRGVLRTQYDTGQVFVLYPDKEQELFGFLLLTRKHGHPYVWAVAVRENLRGLGLCKALLDEAVNHVRETKVLQTESLGLTVNVDNVAAIRLYLKEGFRVSAFLKGYYGSGGDGLFMRRSV